MWVNRQNILALHFSDLPHPDGSISHFRTRDSNRCLKCSKLRHLLSVQHFCQPKWPGSSQDWTLFFLFQCLFFIPLTGFYWSFLCRQVGREMPTEWKPLYVLVKSTRSFYSMNGLIALLQVKENACGQKRPLLKMGWILMQRVYDSCLEIAPGIFPPEESPQTPTWERKWWRSNFNFNLSGLPQAWGLFVTELTANPISQG